MPALPWQRLFTGNAASNLSQQRLLRPAPGFSLIEPVLAAVLLVICAQEMATLFSINMNSIANSHALEDAEVEIRNTINEVNKLGASLNWCAGTASLDTSQCATPLYAGYQSFYSPSAANNDNFVANCMTLGSSWSQYWTGAPVVQVLANAIQKLDNPDPRKGVHISFFNYEDTHIRRFKIGFQRVVKINGQDRTITRWHFLVPNLTRWCP